MSAPGSPIPPVIVDVLGAAEPVRRDPDIPFIYADDLAAVRGDGVFETLMLRGAEVRNEQLHLTRFLNSSAMLDLPQPDADRWARATRFAVDAYLDQVAQAGEEVSEAEAALRWVYSRGRESVGEPTGWITVSPVSPEITEARTQGVKVMTAERGFRIDLSQRSPWALIGAKTLSYAANMAALRAAKKQGLQDVIFVSDEGLVLEGPTSTVIALQGDTLVTPPVHVGILAGTSQAALFRLAKQRGWKTVEKEMTVEDLLASDGIWLLSSVRVQARVTQLNGQDLPRPERADDVEAMAWEAVVGSARA